MSDAPRLSVVIPMRNCGHCICAMLDSLLLQNISMQIVVVDDVSEDDGTVRVEAWSRQTGQPVELLRNERRMYSYGSRLKGLARVTAPIIWCVDADDMIPANANVRAALALMERDKPDILHCKACGVTPTSRLQKTLAWTEPITEHLSGIEIFNAFIAQNYPPAILWNKFFSARLVKAVLAAAPDITVRYFDVKFLGLLFLLHAQSYVACNELLYEYRMRTHRPAWLYARQVDALLLLEQSLAPLVGRYAPDQEQAFRDYCRRRQIIQTGHLSLMAEAELMQLFRQRGEPQDWFDQNILANIDYENLFRSLYRSLCGNAERLYGWGEELLRIYGAGGECLACDRAWPALKSLSLSAREWLCGDSGSKTCRRMAQCGLRLGLSLSESELESEKFAHNHSGETAIALLLANAQLARTITAIMAPNVDITHKAD